MYESITITDNSEELENDNKLNESKNMNEIEKKEEEDIPFGQKILDFLCDYSYQFCIAVVVVLFLGFITLVTLSLHKNDFNYKFWVNQISKYVLIDYFIIIIARHTR